MIKNIVKIIKKKQQNIKQYEAQKARQNQKITCECGKTLLKCNLAKHKKSKIHNQLMSDKDWFVECEGEKLFADDM